MIRSKFLVNIHTKLGGHRIGGRFLFFYLTVCYVRSLIKNLNVKGNQKMEEVKTEDEENTHAQALDDLVYLINRAFDRE